MTTTNNEIVWKPTRAFQDKSHLRRYMNWLFVKKGIFFRSYEDLWEWSTTDIEDFWESIWHYFQVKPHDIYLSVLLESKQANGTTQWFTRATLNYTEHVFRQKASDRPACVYLTQEGAVQEVSWAELEQDVAALATWLRLHGIGPEKRVMGVLPTTLHAMVAFLATAAVGATWVSAPVTAPLGVLRRFLQTTQPSVLITDRDELYQESISLDTLHFIHISEGAYPSRRGSISWQDIRCIDRKPLEFTPVRFQSALFSRLVLEKNSLPSVYSHSVGGVLLEQYKLLGLHHAIQPGERCFWPAAAGDLMWYLVLGTWLVGGVPVLNEKAPEQTETYWQLASKAKVAHLGLTSFLLHSLISEDVSTARFQHLVSVGLLGIEWSAETIQLVQKALQKEPWPISLHTNETIGSAVLGPNPLVPVHYSYQPTRLLGIKLEEGIWKRPTPALSEQLSLSLD